MFNYQDCLELLTPKQQMEFHYEFKKLRGGTVYATGYAYSSFTSPRDLISSAFDWSLTDKGTDYWANIYKELEGVMDMFEYSFSNN